MKREHVQKRPRVRKRRSQDVPASPAGGQDARTVARDADAVLRSVGKVLRDIPDAEAQDNAEPTPT